MKRVSKGDLSSPGGLTHVSARGEVRMVDVGAKAITMREAVAEAHVSMAKSTASLLREGRTEKGDVLATVRIAGIMGAKKTSELIPLCHPLSLSKVEISIEVKASEVVIVSRVRCEGKTGVEMEALTAASCAALCLYDMLKAKDRAMSFEVSLVRKEGGASGVYERGTKNPSPPKRQRKSDMPAPQPRKK